MLERIKRRGLLKAALGGAAAVALGEMGLGRETEAASLCRNANSICAKGCKSLNCKNACAFAPFCEGCVACRPTPTPTPEPDFCRQVNSACSAGCTLNCRNSCFFSGGSCSGCDICDEPE